MSSRRSFLKRAFAMAAAWTISPARIFARTEFSSFRLAFGSCANQDLAQPIWESIRGARPDAFLFLGDNIYGDTENMNSLRACYERLARVPEFARFREEVPIFAAWDDHDYGVNDGGAEYLRKRESKKIFLDFFKEPVSSPRRQRDGNFDSRLLRSGGLSVRLLLLDLRWFRTPLRIDPLTGHYLPDESDAASLLGEAQWRWLEAELRAPADLRILASSIQLAAESHRWEKWANFPRERERLLALLDKCGPTIALSGDMHYGELSRINTPAGAPLYDLTASGLTHFESAAGLPNPNRIALFDVGTNYGWLEVENIGNEVRARLEVRDESGRAQIRKELRFRRNVRQEPQP